jgi:hypothetical protein
VTAVLKALVKVVLLAAWLVLCPLYLTAKWLDYSEVISIPPWLGQWLFDHYRRFDPAEDGYNFEALLYWLPSFLTTLVVTAVAIWLWRRRSKSARQP